MKSFYLILLLIFLTSCYGYNYIDDTSVHERYGSYVVSADNNKNYVILYLVGGREDLDTSNYGMTIMVEPKVVKYNENWLVAKNYRNKYMILDLNSFQPLWFYPRSYRKFYNTFKDLEIADSLFIKRQE